MPGDLIDGTVVALTKRGISEATCQLYNYRIATYRGAPVQVAGYYTPEGELVAQKLRHKDKSEGMPWVGSPKEAGLFGQHLWGQGKRLVITEGEIDALTVSQMQGNKWPVVSLKNGAGNAGTDLAKQIEWLSGFAEIVLMFDMDEAGRHGVEEAVKVLPPNRVKVAHLPMKDANECLLAGRGEVIVPAIWNAKSYCPDSVVHGEEIWTRMMNRPPVVSMPYPDWMPLMNNKVLGIRLGELETWTSGSGMGKTTLIKQLQHHYFKTTPYNQAVIHLEEMLEDTAETLLGIHLKKRMELPEVRATISEGEMREAFEELFLAEDGDGNNRIYLYDAFGSVEENNLYAKIRYFASSCQCKIVWLDHLSILVSDMDEQDDERRTIDRIMHNLKNLTIELGIFIGLIVHLKKNTGRGPSFEEGTVPSLDDLRGSGGIKQLSNNVYALARNQQAAEGIARNTSQVFSLKCRRIGETGPADFIHFNRLTGLMEAGTDPDALMFEDETTKDF